MNPGDGTTTGMDQGITLKSYQKLWGTGIPQALPTTTGTIFIPTLANGLPMITNPNNLVVSAASHNEIDGRRKTEH